MKKAKTKLTKRQVKKLAKRIRKTAALLDFLTAPNPLLDDLVMMDAPARAGLPVIKWASLYPVKVQQ